MKDDNRRLLIYKYIIFDKIKIGESNERYYSNIRR